MHEQFLCTRILFLFFSPMCVAKSTAVYARMLCTTIVAAATAAAAATTTAAVMATKAPTITTIKILCEKESILSKCLTNQPTSKRSKTSEQACAKNMDRFSHFDCIQYINISYVTFECKWYVRQSWKIHATYDMWTTAVILDNFMQYHVIYLQWNYLFRFAAIAFI